MKILRVAPDIYPHMVGGFGIHIHEMSKEQVRLENEVVVYAASMSSESSLNFGLTVLMILLTIIGTFMAFTWILLYSMVRMTLFVNGRNVSL